MVRKYTAEVINSFDTIPRADGDDFINNGQKMTNLLKNDPLSASHNELSISIELFVLALADAISSDLGRVIRFLSNNISAIINKSWLAFERAVYR